MIRHQSDYEKTRHTLLERLKNWDDQRSWQDFFDTYWKLIYGTAIKAGLSHEEAEDVVQETIVTVTKKIKDLKYDPALGSFKGWLLNTTRWRIEDLRRKRPLSKPTKEQGPEDGRHTPREDRIPDDFDPYARWDDDYERNLMDAAIARVKAKASPKQYQVFDCYVLKDWSVRKVTSTLGVSATQVYLAKHRIGSLIKKEIESLEVKPF